MKKTSKIQPGTLRRVLRYLKPYRLLLFLAALSALISAALSLFIPLLVGNAIDLCVAAGRVDFAALSTVLMQIALFVAVAAVFTWIMNAACNRITYQVVRDVRNEAFSHAQKLPLAYLDAHPVGESVSRIIADVDTFAEGLLLGFTQLFTGVVTILGTLVFMVVLNWKIACVVVLLTPLSLFIARFIATRTHKMFVDQSRIRAEQTAYIDEMIGSAKVVSAFAHEADAADTFDGINDRLTSCSLRATFFSSLTNPTTRFVNNVIYAAVALIGALTCIATAGAAGIAVFTAGNLTSFLAYVNQYTKPFNEISGVITEFQNALACAARVFELIDEPAEVPDAPDALVLTAPTGKVELRDVSFSYLPEKPLIEHLNLSVQPGQRIAIVGPTGCGKTTLINLLMRFYDVRGGAIYTDGTDIRDITRDSLRAGYGMVLQETWLKSGTVRENIVMGKPDATDEEVIAAARASHAHSFILRLKDGYDTVLGEGGGSLSQGQKQLLCITRIMLCRPPVLILDEATSSIDTRTELKIQSAFNTLMEGRTSFIVAHRLSTIKEADVILVMKDGHIMEQGKHDELLRAGGFYAALYNSQFAQ